MKKRSIELGKKLILSKEKVSMLDTSGILGGGDYSGSLRCHTQEPMGCTADGSRPGVNGCVLEQYQTLLGTPCPPAPVTAGCTFSK